MVQYLAAAGVGTIGAADSNEVALGDIQSQTLHGTRDVHRPKTASAKDTIRAINPKIKTETYSEELTADNIPVFYGRRQLWHSLMNSWNAIPDT